jgi:hypothetical protein
MSQIYSIIASAYVHRCLSGVSSLAANFQKLSLQVEMISSEFSTFHFSCKLPTKNNTENVSSMTTRGSDGFSLPICTKTEEVSAAEGLVL